MRELNLTSEELYGLLEKTLGAGCAMKMKCPGHSMSPLIRNNSIVTLSPAGVGKVPGIGDVVAVAGRHKKVIIHRVVRSKHGKYLLKGDNNPACDGWFPANQILGVVASVQGENGQERIWGRHFKRAVAWASRTNILKQIIAPGLGKLGKEIHKRCLHKPRHFVSSSSPW